MNVDVYPVGALREIQAFWRAHVTSRTLLPDVARAHTRRNLRNFVKVHAVRNLRQRRWHELKSSFNGYLAEPTPWPDGLTRCGSGWTRKRALRSLRRNARRPGVRWEQLDREIVKALGGRG